MTLPLISVPKYSTKIPSTGDNIQYRPYLVKEEKILMIAMESENQDQIMNAVKDIVSACTYDKVDVDKLTVFDLEYLFLKLRAKSVGENTKIGVKCEKCEETNEISINLDTIEMPPLEKDSSVIMLTDTVGIKLRYPTVKDAKRQQNGNDASDMEMVFKAIISCIEHIFDADKIYPAKDSTPKELEAFLESLNAEQFKKINTFFEDMPALKKELKFDCTKCSHHNEFEVRGLANFFS